MAECLQTAKLRQLVALCPGAEHRVMIDLRKMEFSRVVVVVVIVSFGEGLYSAIWRGFSWCHLEGDFPGVGGICAYTPTLTSVCSHRAHKRMPDTLSCHCPPQSFEMGSLAEPRVRVAASESQ